MRRLLVIDDEPIIRALMMEILADAGYEVIGADSADRALELLEDEDVAAVVSDISMPGLSGLELLARLRQIRPSLPVILVTGAGTYEHLQEALGLGAAALVLKPFSHAELTATVAETLARNDRWEINLRERLLTPTLASALANAIELRDTGTHHHCEHLAAIAVRLGERCDLTATDLETLRLGAILHDVGKIGIPDSILLATAALSAEEVALMKTHTVIGDQLLSSLDLPLRVRPMVRHHHERWDGAGYPDGLRGEEIPFAARIIAIADALEAMSSARPYRQPLAVTEIVRELTAGSGTQWQPELVTAVLELIEAGELDLESGGVTVRPPGAAPPAGRAHSVLLLEDSPFHARVATQAIEGAALDVRVSHAADLATANELCKSSIWSLAVVDQNLPDGTGLEAIDSLRAAAPELPIVMLTGEDSTTLALEAFKRGASYFVAKVNGYPAELRDHVRHVLREAS